MHIAQISDTHLKPPNARLFGQIDVIGHFEAVVRRIEAFEPRLDIVIHSGDLTNDGEPGAYALAAELLQRFSMPVLPALGNHDLRQPAQEAMRFLPHVPQSGPFRYAYDAGAVRIVVLDSLVEGEAAGRLGTEQLEWLDAELAARRDLPTLIVTHHPPFWSGVRFLDAIGLQDADAFAAVVGRHDHVARILCGHVHRIMQASFGGTVAVTAPGTAHQVMLDLRIEPEGGWTWEPPGFLVHSMTPGGFTTHVAYTEDYPAYPFPE